MKLWLKLGAFVLALTLLLSGCALKPAAPTSEVTLPAPTQTPEILEENGVTRYRNGQAMNEQGDVLLYAKLAENATENGKYILGMNFFDLQQENFIVCYTLSTQIPTEGMTNGMDDRDEQWLVSINAETGECQRTHKLPDTVYDEENYSYGYTEQVGELLWYRYNTNGALTATAYDDKLNEVRQFTTLPGLGDSGYFSQDGTRYFCVRDSQLVYMLTDGTGVQAETITIRKSFAVESLGGLYTAPDGTLYAIVSGMAGNLRNYRGVLNVDTGEFVYLTENDTWLSIEQNLFTWSDYNEDGAGNNMFCCGEKAYQLSYALTSEYNVYYWVLTDNKLLVFRSQDNEVSPTKLWLGLYDLQSGELLASTQFDALGQYSRLETPLLREDGSVVFLLSTTTGEKAVCRWTPAAEATASQDVTFAVYEKPENMLPEIPDDYDPLSLKAGQCLPELADQRARADEIEKKYDVNIFISEECTGVYGGYAVFPLNNAESLNAALEALDIQLARYPDGFFTQMDTEWTHGVDIYLASTLKGVEGEVLGYAGGFQMDYNNAFAIVIDSNSADAVTSTINHEMWHAIELKVLNGGDGLDESEWNAMNPDNFTYAENYSTYGQGETDYTLIYNMDETDGYFIDDYSMVYGKEDRARVFEYAMTSGWIDWENATHLRPKLEYLTDFIRDSFDTGSWGTCEWEKPLN